LRAHGINFETLALNDLSVLKFTTFLQDVISVERLPVKLFVPVSVFVLMSSCGEQEQIAKALVGSKGAQVATLALRCTSRVSAS
jgi:hypothetical protein